MFTIWKYTIPLLDGSAGASAVVDGTPIYAFDVPVDAFPISVVLVGAEPALYVECQTVMRKVNKPLVAVVGTGRERPQWLGPPLATIPIGESGVWHFYMVNPMALHDRVGRSWPQMMAAQSDA